MSACRPYREALLADLAKPDESAGYLNAVLEEYPKGFLKAVLNVVQAQQKTKVAQEAVIQMVLAEGGNPTLEALTAVLNSVCLKISIVAR